MSGQPFFFTTLLVAFSSSFLVIAIKGTSPHATTTGSRTGVDLEVVFLVCLQSTLLAAHARSLGSLKTHAVIMRKCSSVDERPGCGYEAMTWMLILMMI